MPERRPLDAEEIDRLMDGSSLGTPEARRIRSVADASVVNQVLDVFLDDVAPLADQLEQAAVRGRTSRRSGATSTRYEELSRLAYEALAAGDPGRAADAADQALACWPEEVPAGPLATQLEEQRLRTLEYRIDARLQLGQHRELIGELAQLVNQHPTRESLWRWLMLSQYRSGRRRDALRAYRRACELMDQLGATPTAALARLRRAILVRAPTLDWRGPATGRSWSHPEPTTNRPNLSVEDAVCQAVADTIRQARQRQRLAMRDVAAKAGVSQPVLADLENGRALPSITTLYRLADVFGLTPRDLLPDVVDRADVEVSPSASRADPPVAPPRGAGPTIPDRTTTSGTVARSAVAVAAHRLIRDELEAERARYLAQISALTGFASQYDENFADSGQPMVEDAEHRVLVAQLREQLAEIERALLKIDEGTYGVCERCGDAINEARLEAMPATRFCIRHA